MSAEREKVDVLKFIRDGRDATAGWPGQAMNAVSGNLARSIGVIEELLSASDAMSRVHIAAGNDLGKRKQERLREILARIGRQP